MHPRRVVGQRRRAVVIVAALVSLAACGGGSGDGDEGTPTPNPTGVGEDFAAQALDVCQAALEDKQAWSAFPEPTFDPTRPDPSAFPQVATWLEDEVAPTFEGWLSGLEALADPPSGQQAWDETLAAVQRIVEGNEAQIEAARGGDVDAFVAATQDLRAAQPDLEAAAEAAGIPGCAEVHAA